jgi:hypothetical protein
MWWEALSAEKNKGLGFLLSPCFHLAGATGLEPATSDVTGRRSNQAELRPRKPVLQKYDAIERANFVQRVYPSRDPLFKW